MPTVRHHHHYHVEPARVPLLVKIIGAIIVIWVAFAVIGAVFKVLGFLLVAAAVVTVGAIGYSAIKGGSDRKRIR
ncbi:MAG: hypothetical protein WBA97_29780 [Actinophytocola sp.]|uniref:hypothetical protein n=1 Tax=Actinophytocola sp. TaxID=1872138 RepID=UPI003C75EF26